MGRGEFQPRKAEISGAQGLLSPEGRSVVPERREDETDLQGERGMAHPAGWLTRGTDEEDSAVTWEAVRSQYSSAGAGRLTTSVESAD